MNAKIYFNGKEYSSIEEMPPDVRSAYEQMMGVFVDKNQNGLPDAFEGMINAAAAQGNVSFSTVDFNGQIYPSLEAMPPEARAAYERAMSALNMFGDRNQNGIPDVVEGALNMSATAGQMMPGSEPEGATVRAHLPPVIPTPAISSPSAIGGGVESSERNLRLLIIGGGILLLLAAAAVVLAVVFVTQTLGPR